jgi:F-type H+-transporting ATPase subunit alpha
MAQYRDLAAFAQFASDLDRSTRASLERGQRMTELLKQPQYEPMPVAKQVIVLFAGARGLLDDIPVDKITEAEQSLLRYMDQSHPEIEKSITEKKAIDEETDKALRAAVEDWKKGFAG